jgi:CubicO group peptidase (beta-lactamase class C family)
MTFQVSVFSIRSGEFSGLSILTPDTRHLKPKIFENTIAMESVDRLMKQAVAKEIFPGGVLLVSEKGAVIFSEAYGFARLSPQVLMTRQTIFDLASLSKPLSTTLAVMRLIQRGQIKLEEPLGRILSEFESTEKAGIKIKNLLYHDSGLPDYRPYYRALEGIDRKSRRSALRKFLVQEPLVNPIGKAVCYSDLGFMILGWVIEHLSDQRLDHFVADEIYQPLGLKNLFYISGNLAKARGPFAATENCPWRNKIIEGQVHDENAYVVGGIEGHAGLFGTADNVHRLLAELLSIYHGEKKSKIFRRDLLQQFFKRLPGTDKALGFDAPRLGDASCGHGFSQTSVGHLGFTGTSFWMDLKRSVIVILLTNRVHPSRQNEGIKEFRPEIHDAVMDTIAA